MFDKLLEKLAPSRVQLVLAAFLTSVAVRYGYKVIPALDPMPPEFAWIGSSVAVGTGVLMMIWFVVWTYEYVRNWAGRQILRARFAEVRAMPIEDYMLTQLALRPNDIHNLNRTLLGTRHRMISIPFVDADAAH